MKGREGTYGNWRLNHLDVGLFQEEFFGARAEGFDFGLLDVLAAL